MSREFLTAAIVSFALLSGGPGFAQVQLSEEVAGELATLGIDTTLIVSEDQLLQIQAVLDDASRTPEGKTQAINAILGK